MGVPAPVEPNPTVARRELGYRLSQARELRRYSLDDLAARLGVSRPQASRLDAGVRGYSAREVRDLVAWYEIDTAEADHLVELATEARGRRAWWQQFDLPEGYRTLIGYEQAAANIAEYCSAAIPGLLQVESYARVSVRSWDSTLSSAVVDRAVEVRMRRQAVLARAPAPVLRVVIDEAALARLPRDPAVRRLQLEHLHTMSTRPGTRIQIIGFETGMHSGVGKHLILLGMNGRVPDLAYSEAVLEPSTFDSEDAVRKYQEMWDELRADALGTAASRDLIASYLERT